MSTSDPSSPPPRPATTPTPSDLAPIHRLPPELIDSLLLYVPPDQLQHTALALAHVFPRLAISPRHVFTHLRVGRPEQMRPMWERLRREMYPEEYGYRHGREEDEDEEHHRESNDDSHHDDNDNPTSHSHPHPDPHSNPLAPGLLRHTRSFTLSCFSGSADILNNILRLLPLIHHLSLNLGTNFAPEHLAEAFQVDRPRLRRVEVRFRPYVDKATYYQFLKGSYFDTAIETMTRQWPERTQFNHFSIVQDVPPRFSVPHLVKKMARLKLAKEMSKEREERAAAKGVAAVAAVAGKSGQVGDHGGGVGDDPGVVPDDNEHLRPRLPSSEDELQGDTSEGEDGDEAWDAMMDTTPVEPAKGYTGHGPFPYLSGRLADAKPATFAQPVVFHDITCLARLARSPAARHIKDLRLRCPGRDVVRTLAEGGDSPGDAQGRRWFPRLRYLDVSTSNVRMDGHLPALLRRYGSLEHLVLDRTNLFGFRGKDGGKELCAELARLISGMSGIQRAKERERELTKLEEDERRRQAIVERERLKRLRIEQPVREQDEHAQANNEEEDEDEVEYDEDGEVIVRPPRAPLVPEPEPEPEPMVYRPAERARARRARRTIAMSSFSVRENTRRNRVHDRTDEEQDTDLVIPPPVAITMILPPLPRLKSINLGGEVLPLDQNKLDAWDKGFRAGWKDGLDKAYEWATRVGERYDRAQKAADGWRSAEELERMRTGGGKNNKTGGNARQQQAKKGPSPLMMPNGKPRTRPPLDVRLYRYPWPEEEVDGKEFNPEDPYAGLIRVGQDENWKDVYLRYLGEAGARSAADTAVLQREDAPTISSSSHHNSGPVLCCIPDCEGPMRKGDGGERVDGRGGMKIVNGQIVVRGGFKHTPGCGHEYGATVFSKQT